MNKYLAPIIGLVLLISMMNITPVASKILQEQNSILLSLFNLGEKTNKNFQDNINLEDDAFHKTYISYHVETWYFDCVFENNYSLAIVVSVFQRSNKGLAMLTLSLYENSSLISFTREVYLFKKLTISEEKPFIKLDDKILIDGNVDDVSDCWTYDVFLKTNGKTINLKFESIVKGWKSGIIGGWWLVIPRLNVTGWIEFDGKNISVSGSGYHDHNWFYSYIPFMQKGWHYCSINGNLFGLTFADVKKNFFKSQMITVFNHRGNDSFFINPENVTFSVSEYMFDHGRFIPKIFSIKIDCENLSVDVRFETIDTHPVVNIPFLKYWRYHLKVVGNIVYDDIVEEIDTVQISELTKFFV